MPGHKRRGSDIGAGLDPYAIDITEIDNFDNLHHAEGIIKEAQAEAAALYGAKRAYFLINGSTCGILAAISAATKRGDKVLVARNCHKAVYHALYLRQLHPVFTYPEITRTGLQGQITEAQIRAVFDENPDIKAVVITSPTYDGVVSDVAAIASVTCTWSFDHSRRGTWRALWLWRRLPSKCHSARGRCGHSESAQDAAVVYTDGAFTAGWDA